MSRTSATFASAMSNLRPAFNFLLGALFEQVNLELGSLRGNVKVVGTVVGICGAVALIFDKGVEIHIGEHSHGHGHQETSKNHTLGVILAICCPVSYAFSLIIQAKLVQIYNYTLTTTFLIHFTAFLQSVVYAAIRENRLSQWTLGGFYMLGTSAISVRPSMYIVHISWLGTLANVDIICASCREFLLLR